VAFDFREVIDHGSGGLGRFVPETCAFETVADLLSLLPGISKFGKCFIEILDPATNFASGFQLLLIFGSCGAEAGIGFHLKGLRLRPLADGYFHLILARHNPGAGTSARWP